MGTNSIIWIGMAVGGTVGGFVPLLWGADAFSFSGILWNAIGAVAGIWIGYRLNNW